MLDVLSQIAQLQRPKLLVQAARFGVDDYSRDRHLTRILRAATLPRSGEAVMRLLEIEAGHELRRVAHAADYAIAAHLQVLVALMGEARLLRAAWAREPDAAS